MTRYAYMALFLLTAGLVLLCWIAAGTLGLIAYLRDNSEAWNTAAAACWVTGLVLAIALGAAGMAVQ